MTRVNFEQSDHQDDLYLDQMIYIEMIYIEIIYIEIIYIKIYLRYNEESNSYLFIHLFIQTSLLRTKEIAR